MKCNLIANTFPRPTKIAGKKHWSWLRSFRSRTLSASQVVAGMTPLMGSSSLDFNSRTPKWLRTQVESRSGVPVTADLRFGGVTEHVAQCEFGIGGKAAMNRRTPKCGNTRPHQNAQVKRWVPIEFELHQ